VTIKGSPSLTSDYYHFFCLELCPFIYQKK
jgi:hypothetical protein